MAIRKIRFVRRKHIIWVAVFDKKHKPSILINHLMPSQHFQSMFFSVALVNKDKNSKIFSCRIIVLKQILQPCICRKLSSILTIRFINTLKLLPVICPLRIPSLSHALSHILRDLYQAKSRRFIFEAPAFVFGFKFSRWQGSLCA